MARMIRFEPRHVALWPTVPIQGRIVKARCRRVEDVILLRTAPIQVRDLGECPVVASMSLALGSKAGLYAGHPDINLSFLLHDGESYWRPLEGPLRSHMRPEDCVGLVEQARQRSYGMDWPFRVPLELLGQGKIPVHREGAIYLKSVESDLDGEHARLAETWMTDIGIRDGRLYRRCLGEPFIEMRADGVAYGSFHTLRLNHRIVATQDEFRRGKDAIVQVFRADAHEDALAYARAFSAMYGGRIEIRDMGQLDIAWDLVPPLGRKDDMTTLAIEAGRRFIPRTESVVGKMDRESAIEWLDLRDHAEALAKVPDEERAWEFFLTVERMCARVKGREDAVGRDIRIHGNLELLRIANAGKPYVHDALTEDDIAALEGI